MTLRRLPSPGTGRWHLIDGWRLLATCRREVLVDRERGEQGAIVGDEDDSGVGSGVGPPVPSSTWRPRRRRRLSREEPATW